MDNVVPKFQPGLKWVMAVSSVPAQAGTIRDCQVVFVEISAPRFFEPGTLFLQCERSGRVTPAVLMPVKGYCNPTGKAAPAEVWFTFLKGHLREWLCLEPRDRVARAARVGASQFREQLARGEASDNRRRQLLDAVAELEGYAAAATGVLQAQAIDKEILAGFYNWVAGAAAQTGLSQQDIVHTVLFSVRTKAPSSVPDVDPELFREESRRLIEI